MYWSLEYLLVWRLVYQAATTNECTLDRKQLISVSGAAFVPLLILWTIRFALVYFVGAGRMSRGGALSLAPLLLLPSTALVLRFGFRTGLFRSVLFAAYCTAVVVGAEHLLAALRT